MSNKYSNKQLQSGMATILMSLIMVITISLITLYSVQVSVLEQKVSTNHYRAKQAFEAAQAGMNASVLKLAPSIVANLQSINGKTPVGTEQDLNFDIKQSSKFSTSMGNGHYSIEFRQSGSICSNSSAVSS